MTADLHPAREAEEGTLGLIITAARACFAVQGVSGSRMEDVAQRAGISRQYLYRFVPGRARLLELAVLARLRELGAELTAGARIDADDVPEAIVDQIVAGIGLGRQDTEFTALAGAMPRERLNQVLTSRSSPLNAITADAFEGLFARALAEGRLRTDVSTDAMVEWLQGVLALFAGRADLDVESQRRMIRDFVLRGLLR